MIAIINVLVFMLGASLASFANVIADRYKVKSIVKGRSECLSCSHKLSWYELMPVISYLIQKGRCRSCKSKLTPTYLLGEILGGVMLLTIFNIILLGSNFMGHTYTPLANHSLITFLTWAILIPISISILIYDLRHKMVPSIPLYVLLTISVIYAFYRYFAIDHNYYNLAAGLIVALPYAFFYIAGRGRWVGLGDVLLYFAFANVLGLALGASMFFVSIWLGAFVTIALLITHKKEYTLKSEIPFTPFIILAAYYVLIINYDLLNLNYFIS